MTKPNIFVGLTAYGGSAKLGCVGTAYYLPQFFASRGIRHKMAPIQQIDISAARNILASRFYAERDCSHLLSIDNDMDVPVKGVGRLIDADKPVIGLDYPKRSLDIPKLIEAAKSHPPQVAIALASQFTAFPLNDKSLAEAGPSGMMDCATIGMGATLIARSALDALLATGKTRTKEKHRHQNLGLATPLYGFFDRVTVDGELAHEDFSFCLRWRMLCQGKVWAFVDEDVGHTGDFTFRAKQSALYPPILQVESELSL